MTQPTPFPYIDLTAREWDLFADQPGATRAARDISARFNALAEKAFLEMSRGEPIPRALSRLHADMLSFMAGARLADLGATDTEPRARLCDAIEQVFGSGSVYALECWVEPDAPAGSCAGARPR